MTSSPWAHLEQKYSDSNRAHRVLALDGGGIRGVITLEILEALETKLRAELNNPHLLLGDWFDSIGGTSTGAIIAAGLSQGMSIAALKQFYHGSAVQMFTKAFFLKRAYSVFNQQPLINQLQSVFGSHSNISISGNPKWRCLFTAVTTNWNTLSPWPINNNPFAKYNETSRKDCNLNVPLWKIVRASTAAPTFFNPEEIQWDPNDISKSFVFVDGGMTPYNNPAFLLYRMSTAKPYNLNWSAAEDKLLIVSVGTGSLQSEFYDVSLTGDFKLTNAKTIPGKLMQGMSIEQDLACRTVGRCLHGERIDREVGDLIDLDPSNTGKAFSYLRFNADLSKASLIDLGLGHIDSEAVAELDSVDRLNDLAAIGRSVSHQVAPAMDKARGFYPLGW
jgi:uncharacterized protein